MAFVEFKNVYKRYKMGDVTINASDGVSFEINKGEFVVIVGSSGCGKSTVLRMVAVSEPFYGFSIIVEGFMQGVGKTKAPFVYNIIGMWGVRIVGTYICTQIWGMQLVSAWACMIAHNLLLFVFFLITYVKGNWNPLKER